VHAWDINSCLVELINLSYGISVNCLTVSLFVGVEGVIKVLKY